MDFICNPQAQSILKQYPKPAQVQLNVLRQLIIQTASTTQGIEKLEEMLKWGEPSYLTKTGSTIRIDWKPATPEFVFIYFNCKTKLIDTFKERYPSTFHYVDNRAIRFHLHDAIPLIELTHCIELALTYHKIKYRPLLGI